MDNTVPLSTSLSTPTPEPNSWLTLRNIFIILLILSFLGVSVYVYLAKGTLTIMEFAGALVMKLLGLVSQLIGTTAEGAKDVVQATAEIADVGLSNVQKSVDIKESFPQSEEVDEGGEEQHDYKANETQSKVGWCYVGEEKGVRGSAEVGAADKCMSGEVFPSKDLCINPKLR